jgi:tetratricopeptide (TPR) repeat protein
MFNKDPQPVVLNKQPHKPLQLQQHKPKFKACRRLSAACNALVISGLCVVFTGHGLAEELNLGKRQTQVLVEKAQVLDAEIQQRQQEMTSQSVESKEYQSGFEDGYNKAIVDLLKSKLLHDPTLSPKPKGDGLYANRRARPITNQQPTQPDTLYRQVTTPNMANTPPVQPDTPTASFTAPATVHNGVSAASAAAGALVNTAGKNQQHAQQIVQQNSQQSVQQTTQQTTEQTMPTTLPASSETTVQATTLATTEVTTQATTQATTQTTTGATTQLPPQQTINEKSAQQWLLQSNDYVGQKSWQSAIHAASQALALDANLVDAYVVRSWAHAESGQQQQALKDIGKAISLDSDNAVAYNNRAYIHELMDDGKKAQQDYQQACSLGYQPACDTASKLKQLAEQQHQANINDLTNASYRQFQQKDWKSVVKTTSELLALDPENTTALVNRAGAYTELGLYSKALNDCNTALILDPNMAIAYNNKGYVLELMGELKKAAMEYETACVLGVQQSCSDFKRLSQKVSTR